jgi:hypothetical protein
MTIDHTGVVSSAAFAFARVIVAPLSELPDSGARQPLQSIEFEARAIKELQDVLQAKMARLTAMQSPERQRTKKRAATTGDADDFERVSSTIRALELKACDNAQTWLTQRAFNLQKRALGWTHPRNPSSRDKIEKLIDGAQL